MYNFEYLRAKDLEELVEEDLLVRLWQILYNVRVSTRQLLE
jgi:hypothetical protein